MPPLLKYPIRPLAPTVSYTLTLNQSAASPRVAETPTIGFPFELSQLTIGGNLDITVTYQLCLLLATLPFISGDPRIGYVLHDISGDGIPAERRNLAYSANGPLTLRPRIRVPQPGYRLRLVNDTAAAYPGIRVVVTLTPLD